jgi:hypothetical protein
MLGPAVMVWMTGVAVGLPPPLCRGRVVGAYDPARDQTPSDRAVAEVQAAYDALCPTHDCGAGELFENPTIGMNAVTWVSGVRDGARTQARIVYSAQFLNGLAASFGPGASYGILAHEVGHHLTAARSLRSAGEPSWNEELRADYLAGCALGRSGRSSAELENALRALASVATESHPSFAQRVPVVRKGYDECKKQPAASGGARPAFGIGALLEGSGKQGGCWGYRYRLREQVERMGPVAAPRRRSGGHPSEAACRAAREAAAQARLTEECVCE